jgi:hypothetical protein
LVSRRSYPDIITRDKCPKKPFSLEEVTAWFIEVESRVLPDRGLLQWDACGWSWQTPAQGPRQNLPLSTEDPFRHRL